MYPVLLSLGKFHVYAWGLMLAVAVIVAIFGLTKLFKSEGYDPDSVWDLVMILVVGGVLGSRLAYILVYQWQDFLSSPAAVLSISNGGFSGLVWYGAFILDIPLFIWYIRRHGYPFWNILDMLAPYIALGYAIVRIGCFLNGCCYGEVTDSAIGVIFPNVDGLPRYPSQLFSSALNFILFGFLIWYYRRRRFYGQLFILYLMGYSIYRFIVEYFRDSLINYGPFTMGQVVTMLVFLVALGLYTWRKKQSEAL